MKKIHRVVALLLAALMALGLMTTAFAAEPTIDTTKKASLNIYKYDITTASKDGAWDAESYVSTGLHDDAVIDKLIATLTVNATTVKNGGVAMAETGADGHTSAENLEQGLYLVVETRVPENATSTCKNTGSLTGIQKPSCDPPKISSHQGRDFRPPLVIVQQFTAIGAGFMPAG